MKLTPEGQKDTVFAEFDLKKNAGFTHVYLARPEPMTLKHHLLIYPDILGKELFGHFNHFSPFFSPSLSLHFLCSFSLLSLLCLREPGTILYSFGFFRVTGSLLY